MPTARRRRARRAGAGGTGFRPAQLQPAWADAWVNYGLARYAQGAIERRQDRHARALQAQPGHAAATANLAALMRITGEHEAAEKLLPRRWAATPTTPPPGSISSPTACRRSAPAEALALLDAVEPPADDVAVARHWRLQRALALIALGRPARRAPRLTRSTRSARRRRRSCRCGCGATSFSRWPRVIVPPRATMARSRWRAALAHMGPDAVLEHKIMARYDLAKFWSREGEDARAFAQWRARPRAVAGKSSRFRARRRESIVDAAIATFTPRPASPGPAREKRRSGAGVHRRHAALGHDARASRFSPPIAQAYGAGERSALGRARLAAGRRRKPGGDRPHRRARSRRRSTPAAEAYLKPNCTRSRRTRRRIVDKMPGNFLYVWLIALLFPAGEDHPLRARSARHRPFDLHLPLSRRARLRPRSRRSRLDDRRAGPADGALEGRAAQPDPRPCGSTTGSKDFDATLARVLDHVDLPPDPACARFYEADSRVRTVSRAQVRQPVNARGLGRWRAYAPALAPLIAELDNAGSLAAWV